MLPLSVKRTAGGSNRQVLSHADCSEIQGVRVRDCDVLGTRVAQANRTCEVIGSLSECYQIASGSKARGAGNIQGTRLGNVTGSRD